MKKLLLIVAALVLSASNSYSADGWYKFFSGKVGGKTAYINLIRFESVISGYYFDENKQPRRIIGEIKGDSIMMSPYTANSSFDDFRGVFRNGAYKGTCTVNEKETKIDFEFTVDQAASDLFDFIFVKQDKKLFKGYKNSPTASYTEGCIWPNEKYTQYEYLRAVISQQKKFPGGMKSVSSTLKNNMEAFFTSYFDNYKDVTKKEIEKDNYLSSGYSLEDEDLMVPAYYDNNIFIISSMNYSFTGGAHGNYGTGYYTIDLKNKKILKLEDILTTDGIKNMPALLEKYFRIQFEVADSSSLTDAGLFADTINVNDNFCLTPRCLMFCYTPYEIGPWALGEVNIYIPINELQNYMKPDAVSLIK